MQEVPKIVRERLKAGALSADRSSIDRSSFDYPDLDHPDANVLTAFAEHSLPQLEKVAVLVHLSRCADCRDVVALALPPTEATQPGFSSATSPASSRSSGRWLTWPALRWGFVAVGVVAIVSVGLIQHLHQQSQTAARLQLPAPQAVVEQDSKNQTSAPVPAAPTSEETTKSAGSTVARGQTPTLPSEPTRRARTQISDSKVPHPSSHPPQHNASFGGPFQNSVVSNNGQLANQQQNNRVHGAISAPQPQLAGSTNLQAATPGPTPSPAQAVRVEPQVAADEKRAQTGELTLAQNQPASIQQDEAKGVTRSKPPETTTVEVSSGAAAVESTDAVSEMPKAIAEPVNGRSASDLVALASPSQVRWAISPAGILQRSNDQGSTWQDVNVMASLVPASSSASYNANALTELVQPQPTKKKEKHARKHEVSSLVFRAVTATGSDVWAGGSNVMLYHSTDNGNHWMQVLPSSGGTALTGDVVALQFLDPQHGKVTTSTSEVWTTADAGQTWQKQ